MTETAGAPSRSFAEFFAADIAPDLPTLEAQREDRRRNAFARLFGGAFVVVIAALIVAMVWHPFAGGAVLILGAAVALIWSRQPARRHRDAVRAHVVPALCRYLGEVEHHRNPGGRFDLKRVQGSGIAGAFTRSKLEDLFIGSHRGTDYRMVEARLHRKRRSGRRKRRIVFSGLLCDISVPVRFESVVLLVGDSGTRGDWIAGIMRHSFPAAEAVTSDHPAFAARYRVYSDHPQEARRLLPTGLMETLLALAGELGEEPPNCAFIEGRFLMAIPQRRNLFEIGLLNRSLEHAEADLRRLAAEFTIPQRLIDNLHGERKPLLPES